MTGKTVFRFNTGGPAVIMTQPYEGDQNIDEQQRFVFTLDGDPDEASLSKSVYCSIEGIKERVGIRIITGDEKTNLLKAIHQEKDKRPIVVFDCRRQFPPESRIDVIWGKGVKSKSGVATTKDQKLPFKTQSPFSATFRCLREDPKAQCMPLSRMSLDFTAPVSWNLAKEITLKNEKGQQWKPQKEDHFEATVQRVSFEGPFPEKSSFTITIPKGLKDEAGRRLVNENKFPLRVKTHGYPPLAKFSGHFGIIEQTNEASLPVTVRNIEETIKAWAISPQTPDKGKQQHAGPDKEKSPNLVQEVKGKIKRLGTDSEEAIIELGETPTFNRQEGICPQGHRTGKRIHHTQARAFERIRGSRHSSQGYRLLRC